MPDQFGHKPVHRQTNMRFGPAGISFANRPISCDSDLRSPRSRDNGPSDTQHGPNWASTAELAKLAQPIASQYRPTPAGKSRISSNLNQNIRHTNTIRRFQIKISIAHIISSINSISYQKTADYLINTSLVAQNIDSQGTTH